MDELWPWLAVAVAGALHGINPVSGWPAVAWRLRTQGLLRVRALWLIAAGHVASMALVAGSVAAGAAIDRTWMQWVAAALLVAIVAQRALGRPCTATGGAGLTLWSFLVSTGHGTGLMLVPALIPLCASPAARTAIGNPLWTVLATIAVHTVAMLLAGGVAAALVVRGWQVSRRSTPTSAASTWTQKHRSPRRCSTG